jgi:hypothetical protein
MKKVLGIFLCLLIFKESSAQDAARGIIYGKENEKVHDIEKYQLQYTRDKRAARIYGISGLVLCGSGMATGLFTAMFYGGATERDPARSAKLKSDREKLYILSAGLVAVSIPLFVLGKSHQDKYKKSVALNFHSEPVIGFGGEQLQVASVGLKIGL